MTQPWEAEPLAPHRAIAGRVRALRTQHGWSAQRLAEELASVGIAWDRSIVANFENGRRAGVSVEEFLALAYVLSVAPVHLLVPTDAVDMTPYRITPEGDPRRVEWVRAWIRGQAPLGVVDPRRYFAEVPTSEWKPPEYAPEFIERESEGIADIRAGKSELFTETGSLRKQPDEDRDDG
jgi:transcriptional regulator with XRE-family HTH domain